MNTILTAARGLFLVIGGALFIAIWNSFFITGVTMKAYPDSAAKRETTVGGVFGGIFLGMITLLTILTTFKPLANYIGMMYLGNQEYRRALTAKSEK